MGISCMMQVDTRAYAIPGLSRRRNGPGAMVFVGMESVNPRNIEAMDKRQNDVEDYAHMVEVWHKAEAWCTWDTSSACRTTRASRSAATLKR